MSVHEIVEVFGCKERNFRVRVRAGLSPIEAATLPSGHGTVMATRARRGPRKKAAVVLCAECGKIVRYPTSRSRAVRHRKCYVRMVRRRNMGVASKICTRCNKRKKRAQFFSRGDRPSAVRSHCIACVHRAGNRHHRKWNCSECGRLCTGRTCMRCKSARWRAERAKRRCADCGRKVSKTARKSPSGFHCVHCRYQQLKIGDAVGIFTLVSTRPVRVVDQQRWYRFSCPKCGTTSVKPTSLARIAKQCNGCTGRRQRRRLTFFGVRVSGPTITRVFGLGTAVFYGRLLRGLSVEEALLTPKKFDRV
jgi:hypothetical protein